MKYSEVLISLLALVLVNSCASYYYVATDVDKDMSVCREVSANSTENNADTRFMPAEGWTTSAVTDPFEVDFYDEVLEMEVMCRAEGSEISDLKFTPDSSQLGNPLFAPEERIGKRFRWFYTYYDYSARFSSIAESLPLPLDGYMTPEQRKLFFKGQNPAEGWNGIEMYYLLDDVNRKFVEWYSDAVFYTMCDMFEPYCTEAQKAFLERSKAGFIEGVDKDILMFMEPAGFASRLDEMAPEEGFGKIYADNAKLLDAAYEEKAEVISYFEYSFLYRMNMPGRYFEGNAVDFIDGSPVWKVDSYRLMDEDLVLEATFRTLNIWAFVLTFALILLLLQVFAKLFSKR